MARNEGIRVGMKAPLSDAAAAAGGGRPTPGDDGRIPDDIGIQAVPSLDLEDLGLQVDIGAAQIKAVIEDRLTAAAQVFTTLDHVKKDLVLYIPQVPEQLPAAITGRFVNPDGSPAALVSVRALAPDGPSTTTSGPEPAAAALDQPRDADRLPRGVPARAAVAPAARLRAAAAADGRQPDRRVPAAPHRPGGRRRQGRAAPARRDRHAAAAQHRRAAG